MRKSLIILTVFIFSLSTLIAGCGIKGNEDPFAYQYDTEFEETGNIDDFFHDFSLKYLTMYPESATIIGEFDGYKGIRQDDKLNYVSFDFNEKAIDFFKKSLEKLLIFDEKSLTNKQRMNRDHLLWYLTVKIEGEEFLKHEYLANHFTGVAISLPSFIERFHEVNTLEDAENYIARLKAFPWKLQQLEDGLMEQKELGIMPPEEIVNIFRVAIHRLSNPKPEENSLYTTFVSKLDRADEITDEKKEELKKEVLNVIENTVYPAYKQLVDNTITLREASVRTGIWEVPNGDEYYAYLVKWHTTTNLTPGEIHDIGLSEVARIQGEIEQLEKRMEAEGVSPASKDATLNRTLILSEYRRIAQEVESLMPELFNTLPKSPAKIEPIPSYREGTFTHHYVQPSRDGKRPGVFYVHTGYNHQKKSVEALTFHETIPGHHLQRAIQVEAGLPLFRDILSFTAYSEGWALYAERLMYEMGYYSDSVSELGYLESELFRAVRLVLDTGVHYKKWTTLDASNYMREVLGYNNEQELRRYIAWPGQALAYKIGEIKIIELREMAKEELGEAFDLKEFHDVVLLQGAVPLEVLEREVLRYIEEKKS